MLIDEFIDRTGLKRSDICRAFGAAKSTLGYHARNMGQIAFIEGRWVIINKNGDVTHECHPMELPGLHRLIIDDTTK